MESSTESEINLKKSKLQGCIQAIPSKSHVHRLLIAAALYGQETIIHFGANPSADIIATIDCLKALNANIAFENGSIYIKKESISKAGSKVDLYCNESGSTLRFMLPVVCALGLNSAFHPKGRLPQRPLSPLREELIAHGAQIDETGTLPFCTKGVLSGGKYEIAGNISSQYITGLLFALPLLNEPSEIIITGKLESKPYIDMTLEVLSYFGTDIHVENENHILIGGANNNKKSAENLEFYADGDWSNAAFWLAAGAIGNEMTVSGLRLNSAQGDKAIYKLLEEFGAKVNCTKKENDLYDVSVQPGKLSAIEIDASDIPDLVPILSLVAACANGTTKIYNAQRLRIKESDRLATVHELLSTLGAKITETQDGLIIEGNPSASPLSGGRVSSHNDHRIAMTAAIASTVSKGEINITGAEAVNKSYPNFWNDFKHLSKEV